MGGSREREREMGKERQRGEPEKVRQTERNKDSRETEDEKWRDAPRGEKVGGETHRGREKDTETLAGREKDRETETHRDGAEGRAPRPRRWGTQTNSHGVRRSGGDRESFPRALEPPHPAA